jgi:murein DD-endopeptidase MepM/ murein hydrolase activator NlpD
MPKKTTKLKFIDPLGGKGKITSNWGKRKPFKAKNFVSDPIHNGMDIGGKSGTRVKAMAKGKVIKSGKNKDGYGNVVIVKHSNGQQSLYGHLRGKGKAKKGITIKKGGTIGKLGNSGMSTGSHLHITISKKGKSALKNNLKDTINPRKVIKRKK